MASELQLVWLKCMVVAAQLSQRKYGVPASVTLAQAILESGWGSSQLARRCNNFFGVKALPGQAYEQFTTREVVTGRSVNELARFAKYPSAIESFEAHGRLLATQYKGAMKYREEPLMFCVALSQGGYATDPEYAPMLHALINQFDLEQYDMGPEPDGPGSAKEAA